MVAQVQLGDVATWLVAVFTGTAAVFAVLAYFNTQPSILSISSPPSVARLKPNGPRLGAQKEREQARLVSGWSGDLGPPPADDAHAFASLQVFYQNRSDEPVCLIEVGTPNRTREDLKPIWKLVGTVPPGFVGGGVIGLALKPEFNHTGADEGAVSRRFPRPLGWRDEKSELERVESLLQLVGFDFGCCGALTGLCLVSFLQ
ncbi:MAG: hypothetical protein ABSE77_09665 [Acidimicrobiales bacterium]